MHKLYRKSTSTSETWFPITNVSSGGFLFSSGDRRLSRRIFDRMLTSRRPLRQKRYSVGMNARIADAGTKYLAISTSTVCALFEREIFRLMMPSKHFCPASKTPEPEFKAGVIS
jgi:hypothetical protein